MSPFGRSPAGRQIPNSQTITILSVGRITPSKGHDLIIRAVAALSRSGSTRIEADQRGKLIYENETYKIRGACFKIWKQFRGGFNEKLIERALINDLINAGLKVENQKRQDIIYNNQKIGIQIFDIVVNGEILIELKCIPFLTRESKNQFWTYLKNSHYKLGLLINFGNKLEIERRIFDSARFPHESAINPHTSASNYNIKLKIIGGVVQKYHLDYFAKLRKLVDDLKMESRMEFLGDIVYNDMPRYFNESQILINAVPFGGLDKVVLEAMASGVIPLTSNNAFLSVFPEDFATQLVFKGNDLEDLKNKLKNILDKKFYQNELLRTELRDIVVKNHNLDNLIAKIIMEIS